MDRTKVLPPEGFCRCCLRVVRRRLCCGLVTEPLPPGWVQIAVKERLERERVPA